MIQEQSCWHPAWPVPSEGSSTGRSGSLVWLSACFSTSPSTQETAETDAFLQIHFWWVYMFWQILDYAENSKSALFLTPGRGRYIVYCNKSKPTLQRWPCIGERKQKVGQELSEDEADWPPTQEKKMEGRLHDGNLICCGILCAMVLF